MEPIISGFNNKANLKIFTRTWLPQQNIKGTIVIVHGFNAHSGYYQWVADQFTAIGFAVYALDLHGRGQSEGERFYVQNIYDYVGEVNQLVDIAKAEQSNLPLFILGHSAGGIVATLYALDNPTKINGLISVSFAFQIPAPDFALTILKGLSHIAPHFHSIKLKNEDFSRNGEEVHIMNNDPLIAHESQPTKTMEQLVLADERLKKEIPQIKLPILILHGTSDKAARYAGSKFFYDHATSTDKTLKLYEGHYHSLLTDTGKEVVMDDIKEWMIKHLHTNI